MDTKNPTKLLGWNIGYFCSFQGVLNIFQIVLCYASLALLRETCRPAYSSTTGGFVGTSHETCFYVSMYACMIITSIILVSFTVSSVSCILVERTILELMFWVVACCISIITSTSLFIFVTSANAVEVFGYTHKLTASVLGLVASGLYAISAVKAYRLCRSNWSFQ